MPDLIMPTMNARKEGQFALTYWNRVEPRPRAPEIADTLAARVRDPLWMLTRQWQFGEFRGEDAGSPAFVQVAGRTAGVAGWRPNASDPLMPISAPLEELVATEGFTPDLATRVELGQLFAATLAEQGLAPATVSAVLAAFRGDPRYRIDATGISPADANAMRLLAVCQGRSLDGAALAAARASGTPLPADPAVTGNAAAVSMALDRLLDDIGATLGAVNKSEASSWRADQLEYRAEVVTPLPGAAAAVLGAMPDRDAVFEWYAFNMLREEASPAGAASTEFAASCLPARATFRGNANPRWWDFERGVTDFGAVSPDRRDLAKLLMMDFMLVANNDYFVIPLDVTVGSVCMIDRLLVHDVFGGTTLVDRADAGDAPASARWTCFSLSRQDRNGAPAGFFFLPPSAGTARIAGEAIEDVRFIRDEQANYAWAIEHAAEGGDGKSWLGHERSVAESAGEPAPAAPLTNAPLQYVLQTFVPRNWFPLVPVAIDTLTGETAFEVGQMVRPDGTTPSPSGRLLVPPGTPPYRIREEAVPRVGVRVLRETVRSRWILGETHLWVGRRRLVGRGEGSSGLRYDRAIVMTPKSSS
jgi:hypothetical protein